MARRSPILDQLRDIPPLRVLPQTIDAECFNTVRLALLRLGAPLELEMKRPLLTMLLDDDCWVAVSPLDSRLPLLQWSEFDHRQRAGLQDPVHCRLQLYDVRSGLVMRTALDALQAGLQALHTQTPRKGGHHAND